MRHWLGLGLGLGLGRVRIRVRVRANPNPNPNPIPNPKPKPKPNPDQVVEAMAAQLGALVSLAPHLVRARVRGRVVRVRVV